MQKYINTDTYIERQTNNIETDRRTDKEQKKRNRHTYKEIDTVSQTGMRYKQNGEIMVYLHLHTYCTVVCSLTNNPVVINDIWILPTIQLLLMIYGSYQQSSCY